MENDDDLKRLESKKSTLLQRRRQADSELRRLKSELAKMNYRRVSQTKFVVGHAVLEWASADEKFREAVSTGIRQYVTRPSDLDALAGSILGGANE